MKKSKVAIRTFAIWLGVFIILLIIDFPIINTVLTSLKSDLDINAFPPKIFFKPTLAQYQYVFSDKGFHFQGFVLNSIIVGVFSSLGVILVCFPTAWAIVRRGGFARSILSIALVFRLLPVLVIAIPMFIIYTKIGVIDSRFGLILVHIFLMIPATLLMLTGFIQDIPNEIEEAATVDGASMFQLLTRVTLPLIVPGLASVFIMNLVASWNEYIFALILTSQKAVTATVGATLFITTWEIRWGPLAAAITISTLPTLLLIFVSHRYIVRGMTMGALKG